MNSLFSPITFRSLILRNRIGVSPMCQYGSVDGFANDWHLVHLGSRAVGGAGLVIAEASAVEARGRISPDDLGIYKDEHIDALRRITTFIEEYGAVPGIQIAHAGRKGATANPWQLGSRHEKVDLSDEAGGWEIVGPSAIPFSATSRIPKSLTKEEIAEITQAFGQAALRSLKAGFKWLEIHAAHGYLLHSFYSPLSNKRTDEYGGSFQNRIRFLLEVTQEVRRYWPEHLPLSVRLSASDWVEDGWSLADSIALCKILKTLAVDLIDCSSGFIRAGDRYEQGPGWQVPLATTIKQEAGIATAAVGMISQAELANEIISNSKADLVFLARELIRDPYWPFHAAKELGEDGALLPHRYNYAIAAK